MQSTSDYEEKTRMLIMDLNDNNDMRRTPFFPPLNNNNNRIVYVYMQRNKEQ